MALREIMDPGGRVWRVWDTDPHQFAGRQVIAEDYAAGWLTFECEQEKRRLAPSPADWEALDTASLLRLLSGAEVIRERKQQPAGAGVPDSEHGIGPAE